MPRASGRSQFVVVSRVHDETQGAQDEHVYRVVLRRPCHPWAADPRRYELWVSTRRDVPPCSADDVIDLDERLVVLVKEEPA